MYKTIILLLLAHKYKTDKIIALHTTIKHDNYNSPTGSNHTYKVEINGMF